MATDWTICVIQYNPLLFLMTNRYFQRPQFQLLVSETLVIWFQKLYHMQVHSMEGVAFLGKQNTFGKLFQV